MNKEELDLLEIVFTLAIGESACNDIDNIQKLEDKIKTIGNLCKKQKEIIDKAIETLEKGITFCENDSQGIYDKCNIAINREKKVLDLLKEVSE